MKQRLKSLLQKKLHVIDCQRYDIVNKIVSNGINGYLDFDYDTFKREILEYVSQLNTESYAYKYSASRDKPCIYASIYAVMLNGLFGVLKDKSAEALMGWADYFNQFQNQEDGIFYDPNLKCPAYEHIGCWNEGWGKHHLMSHIIIAFARLGFTPKYRLKYLKKYYDPKDLSNWMNQFDFSNNIWTTSNYFMNLYTVLEYARDYMSEQQADLAIKIMAEWLLERQSPETGMWHSLPFNTLDHLGKLNIVRAAYHFFPLFEYENISIPYKDKIVKSILSLQNRWGGWTVEDGNSGACEDIDAIDPLLRYAHSAPEVSAKIDSAIKRSLIWQFASRNADKGFSFYVMAQQNYGNHPLTTSLRGESSMFATWFRTLCLAYEMQFLHISNAFEIGKFPGYEISYNYER